MVMLKNDSEALPMTGAVRRIAVIGPLADAPADMRGPWWGAAEPNGQVTVLAGLRGEMPELEMLHAPGIAIDDADLAGVAGGSRICARARMRSALPRRGGDHEW